MAVRKATKKQNNKASEIDTFSYQSVETTIQPEVRSKSRFNKWVWISLIVIGVVYFWYRTSSWPVVAFVNYKPVFRFQVDQALYEQGGLAMVDSLITQKLAEDELNKLGVNVSNEEVDKKVDEIKLSLGEGADLDALLSERGMTVSDLKKDLALKMRVEKAVEQQATVSAQEVDAYLKENEKLLESLKPEERKTEAEAALKQQKLSTAITAWIESLKSTGKVWRLN